jgi:PAS domain S-box-containing protein
LEEALRDGEEKFRNIIENAHESILMAQDGRLVFFNPMSMQMSGYSADELLSMPFIEIIHEEDRKKIMEREARRKEGDRGDYRYSFRIIHKSGALKWVGIHSVWTTWQGKPATLNFFTDITERMQAEEALRKSEEKYRLAFESTSDGIFTVDRNFIITSITPSVERQLGYKVEEVLNRPMQDLNILTPESIERAAADVITVLSGVEVTGAVYDFVTKDGTRKIGEVTGTPLIQEGKIVGVTAVIRDITERIHAQEALRKSEERYRNLVNSIPDIIYSIDAAGNILSINENAFSRYGYDAEEVLGKPFLDFIHPDDRERLFNAFLKEIRDHQEYSRNFELRFITGDGAVRWAELNSHMSFDAQGNFSHEEGVIRDITARKQAEEEREKLQEHLTQAQKMESIGTLAGGIAHDFNNLLMIVQGHVSLMRQGKDPSHPDFERLKLIDEQVDSGATLTKQLLGFARGGKNEISPRNMNTIVEKASAMFGRTKKELTIRKKYDDDLWPAEVDLGQMEQMFLNLFVNAGHAMPGGGEIFLATENFLLTETGSFPYTVKPGRYVKITVADTGVGMDAKTRKQIFDPFFTTKVMGRGTGLGLAMVYGIVKGHGGMIEVDSEPGRGTTFTIYLPASSGEETVEKPVLAKLVPGTETILLVDDEESVLAVNKEILEFMGYRVLAACSGQEAIAVYMDKGAGIDLVILDLIMPGLSGAETYDQLKKINPDVRVLLASGYNIGEKSTQILAGGCNAFLQKPFNIETLSQQVREILDRIL